MLLVEVSVDFLCHLGHHKCTTRNAVGGCERLERISFSSLNQNVASLAREAKEVLHEMKVVDRHVALLYRLIDMDSISGKLPWCAV